MIVETTRTLFEVQDLSKRFGGYEALSGISFAVHEQEVLGLIGPNGAGKTTLLECLVGLLPSSGGHLVWRTEPLRHRQARSDLMFYLPDELSAYAELFAAEVLDLFAAIYRVESTRQAELAARLDLAPWFGKRVGALSRGTRRRLQLAVALMSPQPLLILDEPFNALDLHQTQMVVSLLREVRAGGRTLVLAIHQLSDAEQICDRFLLLAGGRQVGVGTLAELQVQANLPRGALKDVFLALT